MFFFFQVKRSLPKLKVFSFSTGMSNIILILLSFHQASGKLSGKGNCSHALDNWPFGCFFVCYSLKQDVFTKSRNPETFSVSPAL